MIQFNLLPKVKQDFVKAQRVKHLLMLVSIVVSIASLVVLMLAFVAVDVVQKKSLRDLDRDVSKYSTQLKSVSDLNKILTVQNQLNTLTGLHDSKPVASRLFGYLSQVTPAQASLSNLQIDFQANTIHIDGTAPSLDIVSTYTATLKATAYTTDTDTNPKKVFSDVVLTSFGYTNGSASFTITMSFDPIIFQSTSAVTLTVPQTSESDQSNVFATGSN